MKKIGLMSMTIVLFLIFCLPMAEASQFKDVPKQHSLQIEIEYLANNQIIKGYQDGNFRPNQLISKKHIAKMMADALDLHENELKHPNYKDVPRSHPYYEEIASLYTIGIFSDAEYFKPDSYISRAFMAKILAQAFDLKSIADNSVTYEDVSQTHAFYRPVQLVTMNHIAKGYSDNYGVLHFKPNQLLTRAHFSAFLARAITLQTGDFTPNTNYTYYYTTRDDTSVATLSFEKDYSFNLNRETHWQAFSKDEPQGYPTVYLQNSSEWSFGIRNTGIGLFLSYPFTIGLKHDNLSGGYDPSRQEIIETNATITLNDKTYTNVVIVQETYWNYDDNYQPSSLSSDKIYIAPEYGIIAASTHGEMKQLLHHREAY